MKYLLLLTLLLLCSGHAQAQSHYIDGLDGSGSHFSVDSNGVIKGQYQPPYNLPAKDPEPAERLFNKGQVVATLLYTIGATLDATSSVGGRELNPAFRNAQGKYNLPVNIGVKVGVYGIALLIEKKWPKSRRFIRIGLGSSGVALVGVAAHNYAVR